MPRHKMSRVIYLSIAWKYHINDNIIQDTAKYKELLAKQTEEGYGHRMFKFLFNS